MDKEELIILMHKEIIKTAFENSTKIHLSLKDKTYRNCTVKALFPDHFVIVDDVNLIERLFYIEIFDINPYMDKTETAENNMAKTKTE